MGIALVLLAVGAAGLSAGARAAGRGIALVGSAVGVPASMLGVVLFGVHLEALATTVAAAGMGRTAMAAGQALGGALFVFAAAFGVALVVSARPIPSPPRVTMAAPAMCVAAAAFSIADRFVSRLEGGLLVGLYLAYVFVMVSRPLWADPGPQEETEGEVGGDPPRRGPADEDADGRLGAAEIEERPGSPLAAGLLVAGGFTGLAVGAVALVIGGARLAQETLLLPGFIGATVVALLASLGPVVRSARSGIPPLVRTGDAFALLGAATTGLLGLAAVVRPLQIDSGVTVSFLSLALIYTVVAMVLLARGVAGRAVGAFVVGAVIGWLLWGAAL